MPNMTRERLLLSTIKYYGENPKERRCVNGTGGCKYSPINAGKPFSKGCGIGRFLKPKVQILFDKEMNTFINNILDKPEYATMVPIWMQKMNVDFLTLIQLLHDNVEYWSTNGLTAVGVERVNAIIKQFELKMKPL